MAHRQNNFDAIRLAGALLVALGHTMDIMLGYDGLGKATNNQSFGGLGLNIFCTVSGFLIMRSRLRNPPGAFFRSRALRIFPALFVAIPLMAFVLGPVFTALPLREYFARGETWRFLTSMFVFPLNPSLPGLFGGGQLIGQLYSLTAELSFYIIVGLLGGWRHFAWLACAIFLATWAVFLTTDYGSLPFSQIFSAHVGSLTTFFYPVRLGTLCVYYLFFGAGVALLQPPKELLGKAAAWMFPVWIIALLNPDRRVYDMIEMTMLPIIVLGIGTASRYVITLPERLGDISYGVYVYHFAVALAVATSLPAALAGWTGIAIAICLSALIGWISFHAVEKRALAQKDATTRNAVADVSVSARIASHDTAG